jgi:tetratricopeptide (TPR) repeat protein
MLKQWTVFALFLALLMTVWAPVCAGQKPPVPSQAEAAFNRGLAAAEQQDWPLAVKYFHEAYDSAKESPSPSLLFNLGLAHQKKGDDLIASAWFGAYLAADPSSKQGKEVRSQIDRMEVSEEARIAKLLQDMTLIISQFDPSNPGSDRRMLAISKLGQAWAETGDVEGHEDAYEKLWDSVICAQTKGASCGGGGDMSFHISESWLRYGEALWADGDCDGARRAFGLVTQPGFKKQVDPILRQTGWWGQCSASPVARMTAKSWVEMAEVISRTLENVGKKLQRLDPTSDPAEYLNLVIERVTWLRRLKLAEKRIQPPT